MSQSPYSVTDSRKKKHVVSHVPNFATAELKPLNLDKANSELNLDAFVDPPYKAVLAYCNYRNERVGKIVTVPVCRLRPCT